MKNAVAVIEYQADETCFNTNRHLAFTNTSFENMLIYHRLVININILQISPEDWLEEEKKEKRKGSCSFRSLQSSPPMRLGC